MDALCTTPADVLCPHPVVLVAIKNIADLVRPDGVHVFIVTAHLLPLLAKKQKKNRALKSMLLQYLLLYLYFNSAACNANKAF